MGIFKRSGDSGTGDKHWDRMVREGAKRADKRGVQHAGSLACAGVMQDGAAECVVVVWPDRVEVHSRGAAGIVRQGAGVQSMPVGSVASVDAGVDGLLTRVRVHGSGNSIEFLTGPKDAEMLRQVILGAMQAA